VLLNDRFGGVDSPMEAEDWYCDEWNDKGSVFFIAKDLLSPNAESRGYNVERHIVEKFIVISGIIR